MFAIITFFRKLLPTR